MARANVYNKQDQKNKKGIIAAIISVSALVIAGIICLGLWLGGVFNSADKKIYFENYESRKVTSSYLAGELAKDTEEEVRHTFVFVYDNDTFGENAEEADPNDAKIIEYLDEISAAIAKKNTWMENSFKLYLVDTSVEENKDILNNPSYKEIKENAALLYFYRGSFSEATPEDLKLQFDKDPDGREPDYTLSITDSKINLANKMGTEVLEYIAKVYHGEPKEQ